MANPLLSDRDVSFLFNEVFDVDRIFRLPAFADHNRDTADLYLDTARKVAREVLFPSYEPLNQTAPRFENGTITLDPQAHEGVKNLIEIGMLNATRPEEVGGAQLPMTVSTLAATYLMAGNVSVYSFLGLTTGAARLIESFGTPELKDRFMSKMYAGEWLGTMALTEPQAGSSLTDVKATATPDGDHYRIKGTKIFISGGQHDLTENIVHLTLARIEGAPAGIKGVSLFAIPKQREQDGKLVANDVHATGSIRKIGWKAIPSMVLDFGDHDDCHGWLVGAPHQGIKHMFQMMNEARLMVGIGAVALASAAYQQSLIYATERPQGRPLAAKDPATPQIPIIEHADVRRMLLRQKAIVEGGLALVMETSHLTDLSEHGEDETTRQDAFLLLDLLTPIAKTFPSEYGFEANTLAIQIHGGYGYTSEYLPESWWRDQKLNTLHEGTSGIQAMDLLGRKVVAGQGKAFQILARRIQQDLAAAQEAKVEAVLLQPLADALENIGALTLKLGQRGLTEGPDAMLRHASDYMTLVSVVTIGWMWIRRATAAQRALSQGKTDPFYHGQLQTAAYWMRTELVRCPALIERCESGEGSFADMKSEWF